jgi:hypothetical protein
MAQKIKTEEPDEPITVYEKILYAFIILLVLGGMFYFYNKYRHKPATPIPNTPEEVNTTYNGFNFNLMDGVWITEWQGRNALYKIAFRYHPKDLENVSIVYKNKSRWNVLLGTPPKVYLTLNATNNASLGYVTFAGIEVTRLLVQFMRANVSIRCTGIQEQLCPTENEVVVCDSSKDRDKAIVFIDYTNKTEVVIDDNCVILRGTDENLIRSEERFLYTNIFNIMKD